MAFDLIRVCLYGAADAAWVDGIRLASAGPKEAAGFDLRAFATDDELSRILVEFRPQVIVSLGDPQTYPWLWAAPIEVRKRWLSFDGPPPDSALVAEKIMATFVANATTDRFPQQPLVSVFTPAYRTGEKIERPFASLQAQTYANWEWVLYDDSPDDGATFARLQELAQRDPRISVFRSGAASGCIGEVKRRACGLARGAILVELDHDDALTPGALQDVVAAHHAFPEAGFFYSDWAEVFESGENATYGDDWAFGYGSYRRERLGGRAYMVAVAPEINAKTIRHIVSVPNHLRAWTREAYHACGGHSPEIHVCDDFELLIRTFLATPMVHIQRFGYIQYHNDATSGNTQRHRNAEIQRLVRAFRDHYNARIHQRLGELGVDDPLWREGGALDWSAVPAERANLTFP